MTAERPEMQAETRFATRLDVLHGIHEIAAFMQTGRARVFGFRHAPIGQSRGAVLICSPLLADFRKNYRREFELGRRLASAGLSVQRFHYRGTGNSDGDASKITMASLTGDAMDAGTWLRQASQAPIEVVVGTRLGSLVATSVAAQLHASGLVLLDPVLDGTHYLREATRAHHLYLLREGRSDPEHRQTMAQEMASRGYAEVLGHIIHRPLYESILAAGHLFEGTTPPRQAMLIQFGTKSTTAASTNLKVNWQRQGTSIDFRWLPSDEPWWLASEEDLGSDGSRAAATSVDVASEWILALLDPRNAQ